MHAAAITPSLGPRDDEPQARLAALDDRSEWEGFGRRVDGEGVELWESFLAIEGMHCAACSLTVEEALTRVPGVESVQVNGAARTARIVWRCDEGRPSAWLAALNRAGYGALPAGDVLAALPRLAQARLLLWRWLVAGFCMMQVMMYAAPAYLAGPGEMTPDMEALLRWASLLLTLPVLVFSASPFFVSAWRDVRAGRIGMDVPVALGILIAFSASTAVTLDSEGALGGEVWFDSVTMFVFFILSGRLLEQRLRDRTAGALDALVRRLPERVDRERAVGVFESVAVRRLRPGDRIRIKPGEIIPADGEVLSGESRVDEALLTGESRPLQRACGGRVVAGSHNLDGTLLVAVERTGAQTRFSEIAALMERAAAEKPRLAQLAERTARPFLLAVLLSAGAAGWWWWPQGPGHALGVAIAVLIVTCPCALSLATPAATLASAGTLARAGVLVRRLEALETAACLDMVVFDKTGTLTQDRMSVPQVQSREGTSAREAMQVAAALAQHSLHPAARAVAAQVDSARSRTATHVRETPGQGVEGDVSADATSPPRHIRLGSAAFCGAPSGVADGRSQVHLADDNGWLAAFTLDETMRPHAEQSVRTLARMGLHVQLLSGDKREAVERVARRAGIEHFRGEQSPEDKLAHVAAQQAMGRRVCMVGDGMNDAPVLARADVSVAMGEGVPIAQARSDFIILGGQLDRLALVLHQARRTRRIVRQNLLWAAGYNAVCVPLALSGFLPAWLAGLGMAASSLAVVLNSARLARVPDASHAS